MPQRDTDPAPLIDGLVAAGMARLRWLATLLLAASLAALAYVAERIDFLDPGLDKHLLLFLVGATIGLAGATAYSWGQQRRLKGPEIRIGSGSAGPEGSPEPDRADCRSFAGGRR